MVARVLSRDDNVAFIDKPSGLLVHCSAWAGPRERALVDDVKATLGDGWHPVHRLDRQTSGVVVFAREESVAKLQEALGRDDVVKIYWALVRGHVTAPMQIDHALKDDDTGVVREARSSLTPLLVSSVDRCSLVEMRLHSGRRHQARRHLKHVSHPVIGDATHGKGPLNRAYRAKYGLMRMALHARAVELTMPASSPDRQERQRVVAPLPEDLMTPFARLFGDDVIRALDARAAAAAR